MTVMLPAVPRGRVAAPLAPGGKKSPPFPPLPAVEGWIWTWTVEPWVTSLADAGVCVSYVVSEPVETSMVWPLWVLIVTLSASTDSTVPRMVRPAPPNPPKVPRPPPNPGAPLPRGPKLAFGLLAPKPPRPVVAADAGAVVRPTAKATPPMATAIAMPRTILRRRPPEPRGFAGGMTAAGAVVTGSGATGPVGAVA